MKKTKNKTQFSTPKGVENPDPRLDFLPDILAKLRRNYLAHEPGTEAQATSYKHYEKYLKLQATGVAYIPKF